MLISLEFLGAIFSILGAWYISNPSKESLTKAFKFFLISNFSLLVFFTLNGKVPMMIQFIFFFLTAMLGLYRLAEFKNKKVILSTIGTLAFVVLLATVVNMKEIDYQIGLLDAIASGMAVIGSFFLSGGYRQRNIAYVMYIVADILFVYIGYENAFWFFLAQSSFFVFTSSKGLYLNVKNASL